MGNEEIGKIKILLQQIIKILKKIHNANNAYNVKYRYFSYKRNVVVEQASITLKLVHKRNISIDLVNQRYIRYILCNLFIS